MKDAQETLVQKALELGATKAKIIKTRDVVFDPRSFLKCRFGCQRWGRYWTCPPHLNFPIELFRECYDKYKQAMIIQTADPKTGQEVALAVEKEAMLSTHFPFAMALVLCVQCEECSYPDPCRFPHLARPSMDALGVDIAKTIEPLGFKVEFDKEGKLLPTWYGMVLLD